MAFHDVRFPEAISYGSSGGPKFFTHVTELHSGYEQRNQNWSQSRAEYDVSQGLRDRSDMDELIAFFYARKGKVHSFRFKDWSDFSIVNENIGVGDGVNRDFQMKKTYQSGGFTHTRTIQLPIQSTITITKNSIAVPSGDWVLQAGGIIRFDVAPIVDDIIDVLYAEFDVPVRFDTDHLNAKHDFFETQSWDQIPLVEVRL